VENSGWVPRQSDLFNITIQSGAALVLLAFGGRLRDLLGRLHEAEPRAYLLSSRLRDHRGGGLATAARLGAAEGDGAHRLGHL
jgi:hypothetical protein